MAKKYTTISELEMGDRRHPIWALNGSADSDVGQPGNVHVGIPKASGTKVDDLHLPQTWLPICLTDMIPRDQLLAASEFRNAVNNRLIVLISPEFAAEVLNEDGAEDERSRLSAMKRAVKDATQSRTIADSGAEVLSTAELGDKQAPSASANELDPGFVMFANNLQAKTDIEALNMIRSRVKFTGRELRSLINTLRDKPKVVAFVKSKLTARKAAQA